MPIGPTKTKAQKANVVHSEMHKFKHGTLHSGSKQGPVVKSRKQAIAISLSESGQSKKGYDRSSHQKGNPGFPSTEHMSKLRSKGGAVGHAKQPGGKSIGNAPEFVKHTHGQTFADEQREHGGNIAVGGNSMGKRKGGVAHIDSPQGSSLLEKDSSGQHARQGKGSPTGAGANSGARHLPHGFGGSAHGFGHDATKHAGFHRLSGHSGAHRIGQRKR